MKVYLVYIFYFLLVVPCFAQDKCFSTIHNLVKTDVRSPSNHVDSDSYIKGRLSAINVVESKIIQLYTVQRTIENGHMTYSAYNGSSIPVYKGSDYLELLTNLRAAHTKKIGRKDIYFDLSGFSSTDEASFKANCTVSFSKVDQEINIQTINRGNTPVSIQNDFFKRPNSYQSVEIGQISSITAKNGLKIFSGIVSFIKDSKRFFMTFHSNSRKTVIDFMEAFASRLRAISNRPASVADLVNQAKREIKAKYGLSNDDYLIEFKSEMSQNMVAKFDLCKKHFMHYFQG